MKKEYDFQNAEQGKFHRPQEELEPPVYLDKNVSSFFREVARKKDIDIGTLVNEVLEKEISILKTMGWSANGCPHPQPRTNCGICSSSLPIRRRSVRRSYSS